MVQSFYNLIELHDATAYQVIIYPDGTATNLSNVPMLRATGKAAWIKILSEERMNIILVILS